MPKNLKIGNKHIDLNFEHFEIFKYIVSYLGTLFVQEYFCQMLCQGFEKFISQIIAFIKKFRKQKLLLIKNVLLFVKNFLLSNALLRFLKNYILNYSFYQKVYKTKIIPYKKCLTFFKRLFIVKCFAKVSKNIFPKL